MSLDHIDDNIKLTIIWWYMFNMMYVWRYYVYARIPLKKIRWIFKGSFGAPTWIHIQFSWYPIPSMPLERAHLAQWLSHLFLLPVYGINIGRNCCLQESYWETSNHKRFLLPIYGLERESDSCLCQSYWGKSNNEAMCNCDECSATTKTRVTISQDNYVNYCNYIDCSHVLKQIPPWCNEQH